MEITLKNVKINTAFSEETICFTADVYVDGVKTAYARNHGHGGCTSIDHFDNPIAKLTLKIAEAYCKALPPVPSEFFEDGLPMDLEMLIDELVDAEDKKKFDKKQAKKIEKDIEKGIVYGVKGSDNYKIITWKNRTIAQVLALPNGKAAIIKALADINAKLGKGETIWNTELINTIYGF